MSTEEPSFLAAVRIFGERVDATAVDNGLMDDLTETSKIKPLMAGTTWSDKNHGPVEGHN